ncbi:MAG: hypothetical protein RMJ51_04540 [Candidatus Calescibacterium sp.]|nr:hypothetical protein [Candidatus Calescibacterium sp.]MCX7971998.1 hypothetical protein [bacterium]MDW8195486.1 hypothetical protein [Candidatus Calescibacterium sp.]
MTIGKVNKFAVNSQKIPDYPKKGENIDGKKDSKDKVSPDYSDYVDEFEGGGGGNYYEYSGPDGTYDYDPYH